MTDQDYLKQAIQLASESSEPIKCACILVQNDVILAQAFNSQRVDNVAINHAEIKAIQLANKVLRSRKLTATKAYCSCEPCAMCLIALSLAGVEEVIYHQTMKEVDSEGRLAQVDSHMFSMNFLTNVPRLRHIVDL